MNKLMAIRLEIGYCKTNAIPYSPEWDLALKEAHKTPLAAARPGQKRLADPVTNQAFTNEQVQYQLKSGSKFLVPLYSQSPQAEFYFARFAGG